MTAPQDYAAAGGRARIAADGLADLLRSGSGLKLFLLLVLALLPLGLLAVFGSISTIRSLNTERVMALRLGVAQGANSMLAVINSDRSALRLVANALEADPDRVDICRRASAQLEVGGRAVAFAVVDRAGNRLCSEGAIDPADGREPLVAFDQIAELKPRQRSLLVRASSLNGSLNAVARYDSAMLARMSGLSRIEGRYLSAELVAGGQTLSIIRRGTPPTLARQDLIRMPFNLGTLSLSVAVDRPPVNLPCLLATLLPIFLWVAAAALGGWTVNHFLLRPLARLNRHVAGYQPGRLLGPVPNQGGLREIERLGETFREIAEDVAEHEASLAKSLAHQRDLTREVHHRVKNNLQIISSLINLHSRAATTSEATAAYATIQRRVDALSVVHRNLYASTELNLGVSARALISELANALRSSGPEGSETPGLTFKVDSDNLQLPQDIAVPVAFLVTELVELAILCGGQSVGMSLLKEGAGRARLCLWSDSLKPSPSCDRLLEARFGRVLAGLSRQLRAPLDYDMARGNYTIVVTSV